MTSNSLEQKEINNIFSPFEEWVTFLKSNDWVFSEHYINGVVHSCRENGLYSEYFNNVHPSKVQIIGDNWRETISVDGCSSRVRAMLDLIITDYGNLTGSKILMLEAITAFAMKIRAIFPYALGVEYIPDMDTQKNIGRSCIATYKIPVLKTKVLTL